jgi:hypothetical protein
VGTYGIGLYGIGEYGTGRSAAFTQRLYERLPDFYRKADTQQGLALRRYISLLGDQADEIENLLNRIQYIPPDDGGQPGDTSDLTDPTRADPAWLPWLAQLVGVTIPPGTSTQGQRDAIANAVSGFHAGTKTAIAAAAQSALTGTRFVQVYDHSITTPGDGGRWDVLLVTRISETPDIPAVLQAVTDKRAKPAGVVLHHRAFSATWSTVTSTYPTWASRAGKTWIDIEEVGL